MADPDNTVISSVEIVPKSFARPSYGTPVNTRRIQVHDYEVRHDDIHCGRKGRRTVGSGPAPRPPHEFEAELEKK